MGSELDGTQKISQEGAGAGANPLKIGPRTPPGIHPGQFFTVDRLLAAQGPENGPLEARIKQKQS